MAVTSSQTTPAGLLDGKNILKRSSTDQPPVNPIMITADEVPEIEEISIRPISIGEVKNTISSLKMEKQWITSLRNY